MKTTALIYCRVSSQRQVSEGNGLTSQEKRCRDFASNKGYQVAKVFSDEGISGGLFDRPAMKELIAHLDEYPTEQFVIIFDDLARFARDVKIHIQLKTELVSRGAKLECLNFNFEDSEESEFAENILAASNQYQRKSNRKQVIQKMKARMDKGYWAFMPPLGLENKKDPLHGKVLTPREPHASILKKALEQFRDGGLTRQEDVRQFLHDEYAANGLPNRPSNSTVQQVLKNPLYAGYLQYDPWKIPLMRAQHTGFISYETFCLVQERMQKRTKSWSKRKDYSNIFPLRAHVNCATCRKPMTASWNKGRSAHYPNYFCKTVTCPYKWKVVRKQKLEAAFEELLQTVKPANELIDLTKDVLKESWHLKNQQYLKTRANTTAVVGEVDAAIKSYLERIRKTTDEDLINLYEDEIKELRKKKKQDEQSLSVRHYTEKEFGTAADKVLDALKDPMSMWKSDDYNDKKTILLMYFEEQLQYDYVKGFGTATLAYPINLIHEKASLSGGIVEMSGMTRSPKKITLKHLQAYPTVRIRFAVSCRTE